jgi:hypothetical protein
MDIRTGQTIFENIMSLDVDGNPLSATTFDKTFFVNGSATTAVTLSINLSDASTGTFSASFSSSTYGYHQYRALNNISKVIYMSDIYIVKPDSELAGGATIYVGL